MKMNRKAVGAAPCGRPFLRRSHPKQGQALGPDPTFRFIFLLAIAPLLSNCSSPVSLPSWYVSRSLEGYSQERYWLGVALGPYFGGRGIGQVEKKAKADLASQIQSIVSARTETYLQAIDKSGNEDIVSSLTSRVIEETNLLITHVKRIKTWVDEENDQVALLVALDKKRVAHYYENQMKRLMKKSDLLPSGRGLKQVMKYHKLDQLIKERIDEIVFKGDLVAGSFFNNQYSQKKMVLKNYRLTFSPGVPSHDRGQLALMIEEALNPYGVQLEGMSELTLLCEFSQEKADGYKYPTATSEILLYELKEEEKELVYSFKSRASHPTSFERAKEIARSELFQALKKQLVKEIDDEVATLLKDN